MAKAKAKKKTRRGGGGGKMNLGGVAALAGAAMAGAAVSLIGAEVASAKVANVHAQRAIGAALGIGASHIGIPLIAKGSDARALVAVGDAGAVVGAALPYAAPYIDEASTKLRAMLTGDAGGAPSAGGAGSAQGDAYDEVVRSSAAFSGVA